MLVSAICASFVFLSAAHAENGARKAFEVRRTQLPIVIDGLIDDEAWTHAVMEDSFRMVNPIEGAEPTERSELRVLYDAENLYISIRMYDSDPNALIARQMIQDGSQTGDDRINLYIDTFNDQRNGYFFQINPAGTRRDGLMENNSKFRSDWNGIWYAASTVDAQGWSAEFRIPFKTIAYASDDAGVWGFECERIVRRKNEMSRWGTYSRNRLPMHMAGIGTLVGLHGLEGTGVDVKPSGFIRQSQTWEREAGEPVNRDKDTELKPSGDIFYKFHPSVTLGVTANTDFLEAPPDDQRNVLTRFPPFLPERRAFFLQDAGIFEFAELTEDPVPYRSRTIGRNHNGEVLDIDAGAKITGRLGDVNFGGLYVHLPAQKGQGATDLAVARGQLNLLEGSAVGVLGTVGDRDDAADSGMFGADFQYFDNKIFGSHVLRGNAYFLQSVADGQTRGAQAFGASFSYPNDRYWGTLSYRDVGQHFDPGVGGVIRPGIREWKGDLRYRVRPEKWFRSVDSQVKLEIVTNRAVELETVKATFEFLSFESQVGDKLILSYIHQFERLRRGPFEISPGVAIPEDGYDFDRVSAKLEISDSRIIRPVLEVVAGSYYSGTLLQTNARLDLRPSRHLFLGFEYEQNEGKLDEGDFTQRLARARATIAFTPVVSLTNVIQYDNGTDRLGHSSIFRWEIEPGNDVYLIFNYDWEEEPEGDDLRPTSVEGAVKIAWTFRF
ncbi:MAG: carbohydrate binding family 9 domain-containing protein [bacterium]|nr:carbohydrate binding family 9 domain-containing protein [bacterium]